MDKLLEIRDLVIQFKTEDGIVEAVNHVSLEMEPESTLGLVGETGAGKTTLAKGIIGLTAKPAGRIPQGEILFKGKDLLKISESEMRTIRGQDISMIFQDPMSSLNPVLTVGEQISEVIEVHRNISKKEADMEAGKMLEMVGIPAERAGEYPHQFSGGMKQRVIIAIALACNPELLIADEPTTALDVTIQAQVLELIRKLKERLGTAVLLITHDLGVVAQNCDHVGVIYSGEIVEYGTVRDVFKHTAHPYTRGLLGAIPTLTGNVKRLQAIDGLMPDPMCLPQGCAFCDRCQYATEKCYMSKPEMMSLGSSHRVKCFHQISG